MRLAVFASIRRRSVMFVVALVALLAGACQSQPPTAAPTISAAPPIIQSTQLPVAPAGAVRGGTLTIGYAAEPPTLDPHASRTAPTLYITYAVGESLLYLDEHHALKPWLAEAWEVGDAGATFTFHLRHDVTFQDGSPFSAAAVKWNFDRIVNPAYTAGQALNFVVGYQGTDVLDEFTARVRFARPFVPFLEFAASSQLDMLSPSTTARQGDQVNQSPIMSGPYKVDEWVAKDHITLARWSGYTRRSPWSDHDGAGQPDKIVWKFIPDDDTRITTLETGESQAIAGLANPQDAERLRRDGLQIVSVPWGAAPISLLLNVVAPIVVVATLGVGSAILVAAALSFLGLGSQPPTPEWGRMLSEGRAYLRDQWWIATFPGLAIMFTVLAVNLLGDGLRDALDRI